MASYIDFRLGNPNTHEDDEVTRFEVLGPDERTFSDMIGDSPELQDYIDSVEYGEGPCSGTIDQIGESTIDWKEATCTFVSRKIEDRRGFVAQTVAKIEEIFGWTLKEAM